MNNKTQEQVDLLVSKHPELIDKLGMTVQQLVNMLNQHYLPAVAKQHALEIIKACI